MKIDDARNKTAGSVSIAPQKTSGAATGSGPATTASSSSDSVLLSSQYKTLENAVADSNSFDAGKVASIKAAIAGGQFTYDAGKIADGVLATAQDLINSSRNS